MQGKVLYMEDDPDDQEFLKLAFRLKNIELVLAKDGLQGLEYLQEIKKGSDSLPCVIVLDLNMPLLDGRQTFGRIKSDEDLKTIPVVILTSSLNPNDKAYFNQHGADFFSKPDDIRKMNHIVQVLLKHCIM